MDFRPDPLDSFSAALTLIGLVALPLLLWRADAALTRQCAERDWPPSEAASYIVYCEAEGRPVGSNPAPRGPRGRVHSP